MQAFTIDREKMTFEVPAEQSATGEVQQIAIRSNRLSAQFEPLSDEDDHWIVMRSKEFRHVLVLLTHMLATRKGKKAISTERAAAAWQQTWEQYGQSQSSNAQKIMVQTSRGLQWNTGMDPHLVTLEAALGGGQITKGFLENFGRDALNLPGAFRVDYDTKRALVLSYTRRRDVKITLWNRDVQNKGESVTYIVPHDIDANSTMVAVDLASKLTDLLDGISFFKVLRYKYLVQNDTQYVKQRTVERHITREMLLQLKTEIERLIASARIEFFPEALTIEVPE